MGERERAEEDDEAASKILARLDNFVMKSFRELDNLHRQNLGARCRLVEEREEAELNWNHFERHHGDTLEDLELARKEGEASRNELANARAQVAQLEECLAKAKVEAETLKNERATLAKALTVSLS